jgi:hypothetical protein
VERGGGFILDLEVVGAYAVLHKENC